MRRFVPSELAISIAAIALVVASGCTTRPSGGGGKAADSGVATAGGGGVDSIVLERTTCYGRCPAYRVRLARDGEVAFESRNPGDTTRVAARAARSGALDSLARRAAALGFRELPDTVAADTALCRLRATDHASAVVGVFGPNGNKTVVDYLGCFDAGDRVVSARLDRLRSFEAAIDSLTGSARWARPAARE